MNHHSLSSISMLPSLELSPDWQAILAQSSSIPVFPLGKGQTLFLARWLFPIHQPAIEAGFLLTQNDTIHALGSFQDLPSSWQTALKERFQEIYEQGWLLSPGLINAHTHLEQSVGAVAPMPDCKNPDMASWLLSAKPSFTKLFTEPDYLQQAIQRGIQELVQTGTTCINDISRDGDPLEALNRANIRAIVSLEFFHPNTTELNEILLSVVLERYNDLQTRYAKHSTLRVGLSPHAPYTVSPIAWHWMLDAISKRFQTPPILHTHLAESQAECDYLSCHPKSADSGINTVLQANLGRTFTVANPASSPVQYLKEHGLLTKGLIAAHGVYVNQENLHDLKTAGVCLAHCPRSNAYLQGKTIHFQQYQNTGIPIALGTDGHLSTPSLDLRAEVRVARIYHGLNSTDTVNLITRQGATVMGLHHKIGILKEGYQADLALWQPAVTEQGQLPEEQLLSPQTYCMGTWVQGKACSYG